MPRKKHILCLIALCFFHLRTYEILGEEKLTQEEQEIIENFEILENLDFLQEDLDNLENYEEPGDIDERTD